MSDPVSIGRLTVEKVPLVLFQSNRLKISPFISALPILLTVSVPPKVIAALEITKSEISPAVLISKLLKLPLASVRSPLTSRLSIPPTPGASVPAEAMVIAPVTPVPLKVAVPLTVVRLLVDILPLTTRFPALTLVVPV